MRQQCYSDSTLNLAAEKKSRMKAKADVKTQFELHVYDVLLNYGWRQSMFRSNTSGLKYAKSGK